MFSMDIQTTERPLTQRATDWCHEFVQNGGMGEQAAIAAGYSAGSARNMAYRNKQDPRCQELVTELTRKSLSMASVSAAAKMVSLMDARSERVQLDAAKDLLDRGGYTDRGDVSVLG